MTQTANQSTFKICLVSISLAKGGAERSVAMCSQMLAAQGHNVHIAVLNDDVGFPFEGTLFNMGALKNTNGSVKSRLQRFIALRKYLTSEAFDVIIDHRPKNQYFRELFYAYYVYRNLKKCYVIHSSNVPEYFTHRTKSFVKVYNSTVKTVTVSDYITNEIAVKKGVTNVVTIHNAFNANWGKVEVQSQVSGTYILSYGRLVDTIKDFKFLMQSFEASLVWKQDIKLVIMGNGPDEAQLKLFANSLTCAAFITFLPFQKVPFAIVKGARCVTLTSKYEGFPMVLVESLAIGTPVVSLDIVSGPSEIIKHRKNGLLIKDRDVSQFGEALNLIATDEKLYLKLKQHTIPSVQAFSMEHIGIKWNKLLQDAIH
ncbi:glycosyltransferase [Patiriisocius marinus]|uniref:Glycosyl transferase n=1 Tax=Patiriisocius marinus TaxID=1397112 RepID=A0A5J4IQ69_9FLAO|nr:glycosyltransferase [Patiriisocius marinus]GER59935.1 glycosyl transferase [Patiriisocius marinus]